MSGDPFLDWINAGGQAPAVDPALAQLQPGLGMPVDTFDQAVAAPASIPPPPPPPPDLGSLQTVGGIPQGQFDQAMAAPPPMSAADSMRGALPPAMDYPAPPPPMPDAITGGAVARSVQDLTGTPGLDHTDPLNVTAGDRTQIANADDARVQGLDQEHLALEQAAHDRAAAMDFAAKREKASLDNLNAIKSNVDAHVAADAATQKQSDAILAEAIRLGATKVDPDRWWGSRNTGQKIAGILAAVLGGLVSGRTGGPNQGLQMIQQAIDRDIDAQKADLQNGWRGLEMRKGAVAEQFARNGSIYQSGVTVQLASWQHVETMLADEQQKYDPAGTTSLLMAQTRMHVRTLQQQAAQAMQQQLFTDNLAIVTKKQAQQVIDETHRKNLAEEADKRAVHADAAAARAAAAASDPVLTPAQLAQWGGPDAPQAPTNMTISRYKDFVGARKAGSEAAAAAHGVDAGLRGGQVRNPSTGGALTTNGEANGTPINLPDAQATKLGEKITTAQNFMDAAGKARRMLEKEPSLIDRSEWAAITTNLENAKAAFIESHGAKMSSREMAAVEDMFGTNFEGFKDRIKNKGTSKAHLDALISGTQSETDNELRTKAGYTGRSVLTDTSKTIKPEPTAVDTIQKSLGRDFNDTSVNDMSESDLRWYGIRKEGLAKAQQVDPEGTQDAMGDPVFRRALTKGFAPSTMAAFDELVSVIDGGDAKASKDALAVLKDQANKAPVGTVRAYASEILHDKYNLVSDTKQKERDDEAKDFARAHRPDPGAGGVGAGL